MRKDVPAENRKYRRQTVNSLVPVSKEVMDAVEVCAALPAIPENIRRISTILQEAHYYHLKMMQENATMTEIISVFPHLLAFDGMLVSILLLYNALHLLLGFGINTLSLIPCFLRFVISTILCHFSTIDRNIHAYIIIERHSGSRDLNVI